MNKRPLGILALALLAFFLGGIVLSAVAAFAHEDGGELALTREEKEFLAGKVLRLGIDRNRPPFEFIDGKQGYAGISAAVFHLAAERLGVSFVPQRGMSWTEAVRGIRTGDVDVIPKITPTRSRAREMTFTRPYVSFPSVVVTRKDRFVMGLDDLKGLKVGVVSGLDIQKTLWRDRPDLTLVGVPDIESGLRDLSTGKTDAFVDNLGAVTYIIDKVGLSNLKISAQTPYAQDLAFGVRKDWPLLASALDKALASITEQEIAAIKTRYLAIQYQTLIDWKTLGPPGAVLFLLVVFVLIWNRRLGRAVRERERAERELRLHAEELKAQQEKLRETEAWFRGIIESAPDGMLVIDEHGSVILSNAVANEMFGYESEEFVGKCVDFLVPEDRRAGHAALRERFMRADDLRDMGRGLELLGVRKDGSEYPVEIGLSKLPEMGSRGRCVCASVRDVAERRAAERALMESRERLQSILDASPIATAISQRGTLRFANRPFTELFGLRVGDASLRTSVDPQVQERLLELLRRQDVVSNYHIQVFGADQGVHDLLATYMRTQFDGDRAILVWLVDITNIKAAESALKESEGRSRLILNSVGDGIFGIDMCGRMTFANPATLELLGYRENELLGQVVQPLIRVDDGGDAPDHTAACPLPESATGESARRVSEEKLRRKDGTTFEAGCSITPMRKEGGVVGAVVTIRDITERKRAESEINRYVRELERFNRLVTDRELRMIQLKNEVNGLRVEQGRGAKYMAAVQAAHEGDFARVEKDLKESAFDWRLIGNIGKGRPNLGATIDIGIYRLMQTTLREAMTRRHGPEAASALFMDAGEQAGRELFRRMVVSRGSFDEFMKECHELLWNLKIGVLKVEEADLENMRFTISVTEDLDCSGLPECDQSLCSFDGGLLKGLLGEHTGTTFRVEEVNCWGLGDRLCRFELRPVS